MQTIKPYQLFAGITSTQIDTQHPELIHALDIDNALEQIPSILNCPRHAFVQISENSVFFNWGWTDNRPLYGMFYKVEPKY